ncbi:MAG: Calcineurin-like phosphoesterase [Magnetococcales bacterium]|nr:Calcineurin-like phosphoesterase [Magnetococcales bacterium]
MFLYDNSTTVKKSIESRIESGRGEENDYVTILQLTDLHLDPTVIEQGYVLGELSKNINGKTEVLGWKKLDQVVFSGDFLHGRNISDSATTDVNRLYNGVTMNKAKEEEKKNLLCRKIEEQYDQAFTGCVRFINKLIQEVAPETVDNPKEHLLVVPGNHDLVRTSESSFGKSTTATPPRIEKYIQHFANQFLEIPLSGEFYKLVNNPTLLLTSRKNGVVAVIGLDSNHYEYNQPEPPESPSVGWVNREQLNGALNLIRWLTGLVTDRPLYVIVVFHYHLLPVELSTKFLRTHDRKELTFLVDAQWVIEKLQDHQVSLVMHGHRHLNKLQNVSYHPLDVGYSRRNVLQILSCPPAETNDKNGALLRVDLLAGAARVEFLTQKAPPRAKSIPMVSASRIAPGEMRLYREIHAWLNGGDLPSGRPVDLLAKLETSRDSTAAQKFRELSESVWKKFGYVLCCSLPETFWDDEAADNWFMKQFPRNQAPINFPLTPETHPGPTSDYALLLLIRYVRDRDRYEILLNNHFPLRTSDFSAWDTLLMPAFKPHEIREFLYRIKMDMIAANDPRSNVDPYSYEDETALLAELDTKLRQLNSDAIREIAEQRRFVASETFVRFSPTDGIPRRYEYTLTTLDRFAADDRSSEDRSFFKVLNRIHTVTSASLNQGALRWEGIINNSKPPLHRGVVWFPLNEWRKCPAIVARNADVMCWVEACLNKMRGGNNLQAGERGFYHESACLGELKLGNDSRMIDQPIAHYPFDSASDGGERASVNSSDNGLPSTLEEGLRRVKLNGKMDLWQVAPYEKATIIPAFLLREGDFIEVYEDKEGTRKLGVLRPVQRYALADGLARVRKLASDLEKLGHDMVNLNGYLVARLVNASAQLSILPPIIESTQTQEEIDKNGFNGEFLVCDGNHRIVENCWSARDELRTAYQVALVMGPSVPYYATPFAANEWHVTANPPLHNPPLHARCKYTPRIVPEVICFKETDHVIPEDDRYRRYFRDFDTAFRHVGGQGGRPF